MGIITYISVKSVYALERVIVRRVAVETASVTVMVGGGGGSSSGGGKDRT